MRGRKIRKIKFVRLRRMLLMRRKSPFEISQVGKVKGVRLRLIMLLINGMYAMILINLSMMEKVRLVKDLENNSPQLKNNKSHRNSKNFVCTVE